MHGTGGLTSDAVNSSSPTSVNMPVPTPAGGLCLAGLAESGATAVESHSCARVRLMRGPALMRTAEDPC
jgi:hypothetical protein